MSTLDLALWRDDSPEFYSPAFERALDDFAFFLHVILDKMWIQMQDMYLDLRASVQFMLAVNPHTPLVWQS